jgi:hypothetical protein
MKKTTIKLLSILTITLFTFSSCTKDRTCQCTITETDSVDGWVDEDNYEIEYEKVTKKWMKNSANCVSSTRTEDYTYYYTGLNQWGDPVPMTSQETRTTESNCEIN